MKQSVIRRKKIFVLMLFILFIFSSCAGTRVVIESGSVPERSPSYGKEGPPPWAPAHGYRAKYKYRYYPSSRVYYDEGRGIYFYYKDGQWRVSVSLPVAVRIDVNDFVTLEMDNERPYEYDYEVVKRYPPGQLKKRDKIKRKPK